MHANAPRSDAEPLELSRRGRVRTESADDLHRTRQELAEIGVLAPDRKKLEELLANGHVTLALAWSEGQIPTRLLRRAAESYEANGWIYLAADAYRALDDRAAVERIATSLRDEGHGFDAAELLRSIGVDGD